MELTYRTATAGLRALFAALLMRITIVGEHHLPRSGAVVLAANHIGYLDFAFVGLLGRRRRRFVRFLGKSDVFEGPVLGWLMRRMKHVPVDREAAAGALYEAEERLRGGEAVGVFAEGTISRSFEVKPLARGAAAMAQATGAPLIPVVHFGGHRVLTVDGRRYLRFRTPVTIRVGPPVPTHGHPFEVTDRLREAMSAMLAEVLADYPLERGAWWVPAAHGGSAPAPEEAARLDEEALARLRERRAARRR
ncbi:lysophospholipid acyltransferase family protein [Nocardioides sp.]|uniref:lysophospholipid acyltransferase family protein n=1 Tax=Nocardioides sp. TaxID=35761 RepID=UPI003529D26D